MTSRNRVLAFIIIILAATMRRGQKVSTPSQGAFANAIFDTFAFDASLHTFLFCSFFPQVEYMKKIFAASNVRGMNSQLVK